MLNKFRWFHYNNLYIERFFSETTSVGFLVEVISWSTVICVSFVLEFKDIFLHDCVSSSVSICEQQLLECDQLFQNGLAWFSFSHSAVHPRNRIVLIWFSRCLYWRHLSFVYANLIVMLLHIDQAKLTLWSKLVFKSVICTCFHSEKGNFLYS